NIAESPCKFEAGGDSVSINMPTVPTTVFEGKAKYSTYDDAVGVTSSMLKISCPKEVAGVKLSLITNDKITGNDKAIASSNDTVGDNSDVLDVSAPFNIESYKTAEGQYAIPFKAKYLKLTDNSVQSGDVLSSLVMRVAQD
ncbi:type 1 fimbrial protein, partial [Shigella flexneri]|nr:type 1 fimbrial protein [Shigella flexneri]